VWASAVASWRAAARVHHSPAGWPDPVTEYLTWQTLVGAWPISTDRLTRYLEKATREAKVFTSWTSPDEEYDAAVRAFAEQVLADPSITDEVEAFVTRLRPYERAVVLGQKLVQLTMPGVPDVYQGSELVDRSLVDPDNRRPVDFEARRSLLSALDAGAPPDGLDAEKLLVVSRVLGLRRSHPEWFGAAASYDPIATSSPHAVAFARAGQVVTVVSRLTVGLERSGGWGDAAVTLPPGEWTDLLGGSEFDGGAVELARLLERHPVALLAHPRP